jgi:hypothetical protein
MTKDHEEEVEAAIHDIKGYFALSYTLVPSNYE